MDNNFDVAVVGGGAAGLSAALLLSRAGRRVVVIDAGLPRNAPAVHVHDYLSRDGSRVHARRLLVTAGSTDELPDVAGLADRWGTDVLHCPYCHGREVRDKQLGVLGGTPGAVRCAQIVRQWTHDLVYFTAPGLLTAAQRAGLVARAVGVVEGRIEQLVVDDDDDRLRGVQMDDGSGRTSVTAFHHGLTA